MQAKIGINTKPMPHKTAVSLVMIDNSHLNENGIGYFCALSKNFVLITSNPNHPAFGVKEANLHIILQKKLDLLDALAKLKSEFDCQKITIQTGVTLNGMFLREKLFDYVDIVVSPIIIGGKDTPTLIDGASLMSESELFRSSVLELISCSVLKDNYLRLQYKVVR